MPPREFPERIRGDRPMGIEKFVAVFVPTAALGMMASIVAFGLVIVFP